jgi:flagellin
VPAASLTLASGDFTVKVGNGAAVNITGTFSSLQDLADAISSNVTGTVVTVNDDNTLSIKAGDTVTVGGTAASSSLGFTDTEYDASGSLKGSDVLTADDANDMILRIDSALTQVNTLDSTFGAIENRFNSTIDNLSTTEENLTAARSRIQDADFAAETANLTRAQVLQQAGTAMVAQANSLPNTVLSLLR